MLVLRIDLKGAECRVYLVKLLAAKTFLIGRPAESNVRFGGSAVCYLPIPKAIDADWKGRVGYKNKLPFEQGGSSLLSLPAQPLRYLLLIIGHVLFSDLRKYLALKPNTKTHQYL